MGSGGHAGDGPMEREPAETMSANMGEAMEKLSILEAAHVGPTPAACPLFSQQRTSSLLPCTVCMRKKLKTAPTVGPGRWRAQYLWVRTVRALYQAVASCPCWLVLQVHTVVKYTLDKLALVGVMVVDPAVQAQALTQSVGEEVTRMIVEQKELEQRFEQLISAQHVLRTMPNKSKLRQNQQEVAEVAERLRKSTKQLCRNLKDNPNVTENMAKVAAERAQLQVLLSKCLNELEILREMPCVVNMVRGEDQKEVETKETIQREKVPPSLN